MARKLPQLSLAQIYPPVRGSINLNTCSDPDCGNFGVPFNPNLPQFKGPGAELRRAQMRLSDNSIATGLGCYTLTSAGHENEQRLSTAFDYAAEPAAWNDGRSIICRHTRGNSTCDNAASILSNEHLADEISRLRNENGILDGARCKCCGTRYLDRPDEFAFNGRHGAKTTTPQGKNARRRSVRLIHTPCRGKSGSRFSVALDHGRQRERYDNIQILRHLVNGAGIGVIRRLLTDPKTGKTAGVDRVYRRIFWLEKTLLAYERAQLNAWREAEEKSASPKTYRIAHDDIVLSVNWETSTDRRITPLNCSISADIRSGYVFRIDVDFDPRVEPVEFFRQAFVEGAGTIKNLSGEYRQRGGRTFTAPLMHFQRPSGRFDEQHLFGACQSQLRLFAMRLENEIEEHPARKDELAPLMEAARREADLVDEISRGYLDLRESERDHRTPFSGMMVKDTYTKAASLQLLKEMLPSGRLVLVGEQEGAMARVVPHVFRDLIQKDLFEWHVISFEKNMKKPAIQAAESAYTTAFRKFREERGSEDPEKPTPIWYLLQQFIFERMVPALGETDGSPDLYPISNFQGRQFPALWLHSPVQYAGEINKVVGFPIVRGKYRETLKKQPFDQIPEDRELRAALARRIRWATLQPAATFMNALRHRVGLTGRAGGGGARVGGSYINGAAYNPKVLIALLNIYRVYYNFFEPRQYVSPLNKHLATSPVAPGSVSLRVPGSESKIKVSKRRHLAPRKETPAMRLGITPVPKDPEIAPKAPDLTRVLYRPWLYAGTPLFGKLEGR